MGTLFVIAMHSSSSSFSAQKHSNPSVFTTEALGQVEQVCCKATRKRVDDENLRPVIYPVYSRLSEDDDAHFGQRARYTNKMSVSDTARVLSLSVMTLSATDNDRQAGRHTHIHKCKDKLV